MTPCTHSDSQTHFGLIKAALKSWLVSILLFFVSLNAHTRWGHRSKFACGCTYPSPHSTDSIQPLQLLYSCLRESFCTVCCLYRPCSTYAEFTSLGYSCLLSRRFLFINFITNINPFIYFFRLFHLYQVLWTSWTATWIACCLHSCYKCAKLP